MAKNNILRSMMAALAVVTASGCCWAYDTALYSGESRLAHGAWVKIRVDESGVYKITQSDARKWGFSDISKLHVYGYGAKQVPEVLTAATYIDDLPQVQVLRRDNAIYFYAQGPVSWTTASNISYCQVQHTYSTAGYYFVSEDAEVADRDIAASGKSVDGSASVVNQFTDRLCHESELVNAGETGRQFFGEDFRYNTNQTFKFQIPDYVSGSNVNVLTCFGANCEGGSSRLSFSYNGTQLGYDNNDYIGEVSSEYTHMNVVNSLKTFTLNNASDFSYTIGLQYGGTLNAARLDYITVNYQRNLKLNDGKLAFSLNTTGPATLALAGATDATVVWDVTDVTSVVKMDVQATSDGVAFAPYATGERNYVAFNENASLPTPELVGSADNQNIHGEAVPDMIIITPREYFTQAKRVASLHETNDAMRVLVVTDQSVYNEFSSGTPDVMAYRNMCKMFYDRGADSIGHKLKYLLLFGDGSYDNRNVSSAAKNNLYPRLLTYQSEASTSEYTSYVSDDPLVFLSDGMSGNLLTAKLSIAVGRMPVKSVSEAKNVVDKLYKYVNNNDFGNWKSVATVIADDQNHSEHAIQAEAIIDLYMKNGAADLQYNKIYVDAYDNPSSGSSRVCQVGREKMFKQFDEGMLWLSYIGHGSPTSWTAEQLLSWKDINSFYNKRWPFMFAATCEFSRFDANTESGGEIMYVNDNGGVIAELSSARLVYIPNNGALNKAIAKYAFARDTDGKHYTIGEFVRKGKNDVIDDNRLRFILFGDPAMRLRVPDYQVKIESINGYAVGDDNMPTFQARQTLTFAGSIVDSKGNVVPDFSGNIVSTLYDAEQSVVTKGYGDDGDEYVYQDRSNRLALVSDSVTNGKFAVKITVPSELSATASYDNYSPARICMYAYSSDTAMEAMGSNDEFYVYGVDETVSPSTEAPEIRSLLLNSDTFNDGDNVNESPLVIADVFDRDGINFSSAGIGHDITVRIDDNTTYNDVSSYFTPVYDKDGYAGTIAYQLENLTEGEHTLTLKVWDVFNNSAEKTISFNVVKGLKPEIYDVYTTSIPAVDEAVFYIKHNRPDALMTITLQVYDLMGRMVWSNTQTGRSDLYTAPVTWNLTDSTGSRVQRGIYVYRASISTDGETFTTKSKKIAVAGE